MFCLIMIDSQSVTVINNHYLLLSFKSHNVVFFRFVYGCLYFSMVGQQEAPEMSSASA